jgi:predicted glutamine amidotransferase
VFVAHVRYASTGELSVANTHPFVQDNRLFAHNGAFAGLDRLDTRLKELDAAALVEGQTDSERLFALITAETRRRDHDVAAGLVAAVTWVAHELPVYCPNLILASVTDMWALRYPATNELHLLQRPAADGGHPRPPDVRSQRIHARSDELARMPPWRGRWERTVRQHGAVTDAFSE